MPSGRRRHRVTVVPAGSAGDGEIVHQPAGSGNTLAGGAAFQNRIKIGYARPAIGDPNTNGQRRRPGDRKVDPAATGIGECIPRDLRNRSRQSGLAGRVQPGQRSYLPSTMACHDDVFGLGQGNGQQRPFHRVSPSTRPRTHRPGRAHGHDTARRRSAAGLRQTIPDDFPATRTWRGRRNTSREPGGREADSESPAAGRRYDRRSRYETPCGARRRSRR